MINGSEIHKRIFRNIILSSFFTFPSSALSIMKYIQYNDLEILGKVLT